MAVTAVGFTGTVDEAQWASLWNAVGPREAVVGLSDLIVTVAGGDRTVSVAAGQGWVSGVLFTLSPAQTVSLGANSSGLTRVDTIIALVNWSANTVTITSKAGTASSSPVPATLTRTAGTTWELPLAYVTVASGVGALAAGTVQDRRPPVGQRHNNPLYGTYLGEPTRALGITTLTVTNQNGDTNIQLGEVVNGVMSAHFGGGPFVVGSAYPVVVGIYYATSTMVTGRVYIGTTPQPNNGTIKVSGTVVVW